MWSMSIWEDFINPHLETAPAGDVLPSFLRHVEVDVKVGVEDVAADVDVETEVGGVDPPRQSRVLKLDCKEKSLQLLVISLTLNCSS